MFKTCPPRLPATAAAAARTGVPMIASTLSVDPLEAAGTSPMYARVPGDSNASSLTISISMPGTAMISRKMS